MRCLRIVLGVLMMSLFFLGSGAYSSEPPPAEAAIVSVQRPNFFAVRGAGIEITYSTSSIGGLPLLTYKDKQRTLMFQGDEISRLESEIGQQVTVIIEQIPDLRTVTFTLVLPTINLDGSESRFQTIGITATHRTSIGGPDLVKGALQTYHVKGLKGIAQWVNF